MIESERRQSCALGLLFVSIAKSFRWSSMRSSRVLSMRPFSSAQLRDLSAYENSMLAAEFFLLSFFRRELRIFVTADLFLFGWAGATATARGAETRVGGLSRIREGIGELERRFSFVMFFSKAEYSIDWLFIFVVVLWFDMVFPAIWGII